MKNVIRNEKIVNHNIEPYRFKVLGSLVSNANSEEDEDGESQELAQESPNTETKTQEVQTSEEVSQESPSKPMVEDAFVEKLLEKTDELSSNIIKLQMQIENQEEEFERRLKEATEKAKEDGLKEGEEKATTSFESKLTQLQTQYTRSIKLLNEEHGNFKAFITKSEQELSNIAIDVSKEVIQKEISQNSKEVALSLAKSLMKELEGAAKIEVKVNPSDFEYIQEALREDENIQVKADDAILQGGVIILSDSGNLDGSIDLRLAKIKQMAQE